MRFKTVLIFLGGIAVGGIAIFALLGLQGDGGEPAVAEKAGRPAWMAPPAASAPPQREEKERELIVGVIGPETGAEANYGLAVLTGITMAAERFNAQGGLRGEKIKIIHHDNSGGSGQALDIAEALIKKNVVAIFSAPTGWSTFAPTHLVNGAHTVFISIGTRRKISRSGSYIFHFALPDEVAIDEILGHAVKQLGYRNFALITSSSYDYSLSIASLFKQAVPRHGGKILLEADTYDTFSGQTDIGKVTAALKTGSDELQAIIFTGGVQEAALLAKAAKTAGGPVLPMIGGEDLFSGTFLKQGGPAVRGALLYATFAPDHPSALVGDFVAAHKARKKAVPDRFTALAYDAFGLLAQALKDAPSLQGPAVRDALVKLKTVEGVTGPGHWAADGAPVKRPYLYRVAAGQSGEEFALVQTMTSKQ
ncbi:MAG: ABC transporter substrate-binding protein [Alphaproteobacteria bacterium]|jgi:branched-chain amino acid transport system substrate-binding protein|nr:ABC transporter substrate-binding protein [Alphaproteobacteria bacterium]MDP6873036.1 ABC transporter substrate-binding protein [Alphaproteobacteria bacterium]